MPWPTSPYRDWNSSVPYFRSSWLPKYPHVDITIQPEPPATGIDQKILIWGLNTALYNMIIWETFVDSKIDLLWSNKKVAEPHFSSRPRYLAPPSTGGAGLGNLSLGLSVPLDNVTDAAAVEAHGAIPHVEFRTLPHPSLLGRGNVFAIVATTLRYIAFPPATDIYGGAFTVGPMPGHGLKIMITGRDGPGLPRRAPPYTRALPEWMLDHDNFKESSIGIYVSNTFVGGGFVVDIFRNATATTSGGLLLSDLPVANASTS